MMRICLILFLALVSFAHAEGLEYDSYPVSDGNEVDVNEVLIAKALIESALIESALIESATMVTGKIRSLDFAEDSTIISGFRYHFGSATGIDRCVVRMLNRDFGAVELLQANMFVEVYYVQKPGRRLAKLIIQTDAGEEF
jgi:hypothetical protein